MISDLAEFKDFLITLSKLLRGSLYERLQWIFKFYDQNGDGYIYRKELSKLIQAVHDLTGQNHANDDRKIRNQVWMLMVRLQNDRNFCFVIFVLQVDYLFRKFDLNRDGVITIDEFIEACLKDNVIIDSIQIFDKDFYA